MGADRGWPELLESLDRHSPPATDSGDTWPLADLMRLYRMPGLSIAVAEPGVPLWTGCYGRTAGDGGAPVTARTPFQACSISKHVAAFGALRLVDQGVLALDGDVHEHLTSWTVPAEAGWRARVTLRQLLAHTAGLSYAWFRGYAPGEPLPAPHQTLRGEPPANTPPVRVTLLPGSRFRYSGSHYAVLQQLLLDATGTPFDELMAALVLRPLGMVDSSYDQRFPQRAEYPVARGHHRMGTPVPGGWRVIPEQAGAGLWTTPSDLVRLEREIAAAVTGDSRLLPAELARQMLAPAVLDGYGLGTELAVDDGHEHALDDGRACRRFGHTGESIGYLCWSFGWPAAGAAMAVMTNIDDPADVPLAILAAADRRYGGQPRRRAVDDVAGHYPLRDDYPIEIAERDGRRWLSVPGQPPAPLTREPDGRYRQPALDVRVGFHQDDQGRPVLDLWQAGTHQAVTRADGP